MARDSGPTSMGPAFGELASLDILKRLIRELAANSSLRRSVTRGPAPLGTQDAAAAKEALGAPHDSLELLTIPDVAKLFKIGRSSVYELMRRGEFPTIRIGRSVRVC